MIGANAERPVRIKQKAGIGDIDGSGRRDEPQCIPLSHRGYRSDERLVFVYNSEGTEEAGGRSRVLLHTMVQYAFCKIGSQ